MKKLEDLSIIAWIFQNGIKIENGELYDLKSHLFWYDVLRDWHPKQVWLKAAQVGGSVAANLKLFYAMKMFGLNACYTLPTAQDAKEFVSGKTNMLIIQNPVLQEWTKDKDSIEQKRIGDHVAYFRGTFTERAALSFSSDLNVHDEVDRSEQKVISQYASRQQHSKYQWEWRFSNPSSEGNGVAKQWAVSDQREWHIVCPTCETQQKLEWPRSINEKTKQFVCTHCAEPVDDETRRKGEWIAMKPENTEWRGYHFSLLMAPWVAAEQILTLHRTKSAEYFSNFVLGEPFVGNGSKLTEDEFFANLTDETHNREAPIIIGVDTGLPIWYVVGNRKGVFFHGKCNDYRPLEELLAFYPNSIIVSDQGGDLIGIRKLQEAYPGRVFLCYYRQDRKTMQMIDWGKGEESGKVVVDRNRLIQQVMDELRDKRIPIHGTKAQWWPLWEHLANMYRVVEEDTMGNERFVWERSGADHLGHTLFYWRTGVDKFGYAEAFHTGLNMEMSDVEVTYAVRSDNKVQLPKFKKPHDWRD